MGLLSAQVYGRPCRRIRTGTGPSLPLSARKAELAAQFVPCDPRGLAAAWRNLALPDVDAGCDLLVVRHTDGRALLEVGEIVVERGEAPALRIRKALDALAGHDVTRSTQGGHDPGSGSQ